MPDSMIARPSSIVTASATVTWAVGTADANYPIANVKTMEPDVVAKTTGSSATLRLTFGSAVSLEGLAAINTNWGGLTVNLSNNGGLTPFSAMISNPANKSGMNAWWDLRGRAGRSATQWDIAIPVVGTVPNTVAIGTIVPVTLFEELRCPWEYSLQWIRPSIEQRSGLDKRFRYRIPVQYRVFTAEPHMAVDRNILRRLREESDFNPFLLVHDMDDTDIALVQFANEPAMETYSFYRRSFRQGTVEGQVYMPFVVEELNPGVRLVTVT